MKPRWPALLTAVAGYVLVALITTFPLVRHLTSAFPASGTDVYGFIWNNWWIHRAVTELHTSPLFTNAIFAPFTSDLRLHTFGLLYGLLSVPFMSTLNPIGVLNAQILATIVLNGYAAFRLTTYLTKSAPAGFVSGLIIAASPAITFHLGVGRPSCAALWPAIFAITALLHLADRPGWRTSAWLSLWLVATVMVDQQVALFAACWLVVLAIARLGNWGSGKWAAATAIVAAVPAVFLYSGFFGASETYNLPAAAEALKYSYPPRLFWTPAMIWSVYGSVMPLGLIVSLWWIRRDRAIAPWLVGSVLFLVFSLGPVAMGSEIPLPFSIVQWLPGLEQFRTPYRFQIPAAIGLAVLVGILVAHGLNRFEQKRGQLLLVGVVLLTLGDVIAHRVVGGFKIQPAPTEAIYTEISRDARDTVVLEIPFGVRTGTDRIGPGETLTIFQPVHGKRLMNGFLARAPLAALDYYRASPAIMFLAGERPLSNDVAEDLQRKLRELEVGYIVIHPDMMDATWLKETMDVTTRLEDVQRLDTDDRVIAFRVAR